MEPNPGLRVLIVEDSENDAMLLQLELRRAGFKVVSRRVDTKEGMESALASQQWDLVIADYVMPRFNGLEALALSTAHGLDAPFIIVSGHITDNTAVAAMKAGAHDYVMKDNLARLGPAVRRELREAEIRRERRRSDEKLSLEQGFRQAIENSVSSGIAAVDLDGRQTYVNQAFCAMVGWSEPELLGAAPPFVYWPPEQADSISRTFAGVIRAGVPASGIELRFRRRNNERLDVLLQVTPLQDVSGKLTGWVSSATDITERKRAEARLAAEHGITRLLVNAQSLDEAAPGIIQVLLDRLDLDVGTLWVVDAKARVLNPSVSQARSSLQSLRPFIEASRNLTFGPGDYLPGRVWQEGKVVWPGDLASGLQLQRQKAAVAAGLQSGVALPIQSAQDFFGVIELFALGRMEPNEALANMMTAIGYEVGQFVHRRSAEEALRRAHDELEIRVQHRTAELEKANAQLQASIADRRRLENELLEITEKERRRIGLDLHDDLGQRLSGIALMTKGLELKLTKQGRGGAEDAGRIHRLVQETMNHASELAHDLATLDLAQKDLPAALDDLAGRASQLFGIECRFTTEGAVPALDPSTVAQLCKITQEAVTNAIKHGKAKRVVISLVHDTEKLNLTIQNNGLPFPDFNGPTTGMGLRIMNYRASLIGGRLTVKPAGQKGTVVVFSLPSGKR